MALAGSITLYAERLNLLACIRAKAGFINQIV